LRSRLDDLESLAPFILRQQAELAGRTPPKLSDEALKRLKRHRWPGNVRELRNVLGSALAVSAGAVLEIGEHLLDSGLRVGSYRLVERLGAGGMGEVWLGRHQLLARPAAIKIVRDAAIAADADGQTIRERFAREAQTTAELRSPHTVQLFDFGLTETGAFYYVMEQLRGLDLQRMVERHGPTPPERAVCLLKQACRSLSEAHALGLVHRDIKPANLFVCRLGQEYDFLKVLDFGVVSRQDRDASASITMTGMVLGTPAYLAPELLGGAGSFDHRVDLYALGCVAYWLLTGRTPFETRDTMTLLQHTSTTTPTAPSQISTADVSPEMDALVLECLSKDPSGRPANADVLWERLDRLPIKVPWDPRHARRWWEQHEPDVA
jgi:serine/threonine-protein kinase